MTVNSINSLTGMKKMEYKTRQWHEKCFVCNVCKNPIGTRSFIPKEHDIYCAKCYEDKFATKCTKCSKVSLQLITIIISGNRLIIFITVFSKKLAEILPVYKSYYTNGKFIYRKEPHQFFLMNLKQVSARFLECRLFETLQISACS